MGLTPFSDSTPAMWMGNMQSFLFFVFGIVYKGYDI